MLRGHRISTRPLQYSIPPLMASCRCECRPSVRSRHETEHIGHSTCYSPVHTAANVHLAIRCAQVLNVKETWRPISEVLKTVPGDSRGPSEVVPISAPRPSARVGLMPFGLGFWLCLGIVFRLPTGGSGRGQRQTRRCSNWIRGRHSDYTSLY